MRIVDALPLVAPDLWRRSAARLPPGEWERWLREFGEMYRQRLAVAAVPQFLVDVDQQLSALVDLGAADRIKAKCLCRMQSTRILSSHWRMLRAYVSQQRSAYYFWFDLTADRIGYLEGVALEGVDIEKVDLLPANDRELISGSIVSPTKVNDRPEELTAESLLRHRQSLGLRFAEDARTLCEGHFEKPIPKNSRLWRNMNIALPDTLKQKPGPTRKNLARSVNVRD